MCHQPSELMRHVPTACIHLVPDPLSSGSAVWPRAARADTLSTLDRKRSGFEAKTLRGVLKGVESLLLEVELIA